jgi:acyl carrier protein phosphodiesterase
VNYLAHLLLSRGDAQLQVGNFIGDFVRGRELSLLPEGIQRGVWMHRAIDRLTDQDPDVRALNRLVREHHGRYAAVITDIAFDESLHRDWSRYATITYADFKQETYALLLRHADGLPGRMQPPLRQMVAGDWLEQYTSRDGMHSVFRRFRRRMSQPHRLDGIERTLCYLEDDINRTFSRLFPRLQTLAAPYFDDPRPT